MEQGRESIERVNMSRYGWIRGKAEIDEDRKRRKRKEIRGGR